MTNIKIDSVTPAQRETLNAQLVNKLDQLRADYESVVGRPFQHFFCPILWSDEHTELCRAHVINRGFGDSDKSWTVQRADVDAWYGTLFEDDFLAIEKKDQPVVEKSLTDSGLARRFKPRLTMDGEDVNYYVAKGPVPEAHTPVEVDIEGRTVRLGLKLSPNELLSNLDDRWQFRVEKDLRLPALASVLKSAHLTMFHLLGYRYALSASGFFLGKTVLGEFFLKTQGIGRTRALKIAEGHFKQFAGLVRPITAPSPEFMGTITDGLGLFFMSGSQPWAFQVVIRTGNHRHAAIVPIIEDAESAARFCSFLESPSRTVEIRVGRLSSDQVEISSKAQSVEWPEAPFDAPMPEG